MLDIKLIREDPEGVLKKLQTKDAAISLDRALGLDQQLRDFKHKVEELKAERNAESKKIGEMKRSSEDTSSLMARMGELAEQVKGLDHQLKEVEEELHVELSRLPNVPMDDIPVHMDPKENVLISEFGKKPEFGFAFKNHLELNEKLKIFDFKRGAKMSGTGWPVYRGMGARLEWALLQYMLEIHLKNGFEQVMIPHCVRPEAMYAAAQLPKFKDQLFAISDKDYELYLIPTAEVGLNGLYMDEIIEELPKKMVSYTPCFRREAGAAGAGERGLIRIHQFNKVELFCITTPEESAKVFDQMVASAEEVLQGLGIHYRNMLLVTGDMSFASARTVDIEVWLPGQEHYYEVSSVSNCTDFQARRSKMRFRGDDGKPQFVHTLNGSGVATSRLMVGLLENNQQEDGSVLIPKALQKYVGCERIS